MKRVVVVVAGPVVGVGVPDIAGTSRRPRFENDAGFEAVTAIKAIGFVEGVRSTGKEDGSCGRDLRFFAERASSCCSATPGWQHFREGSIAWNWA
jgi:hypothetical protein